MNLVPRKCIVNSRSECDTSTCFGPYNFKLPVVPANMECVINPVVAEMLARAGYFYIMHRFQLDIPAFVKHMHDAALPISISVGVNEDSYETLKILKENNTMPHYITIDIAHGHSVKMEHMISFIRKLWTDEKQQPFIIAGNVSTADAVRDLETWGANAIKCGIGPGCFAANTRVLMADGTYKNIQDISVGDYVVNMNKKPVKVLAVKNSGIRQVIKIKNYGHPNPVYVTPDHLFYVASTVDYKNVYSWKEIGECQPGDSVLYPHSENVYTGCELFIDKASKYMETWDIEVDCPTHSFVANNMIVHNSACTTYPSTGFGSRGCQAAIVAECAKAAKTALIVADGGIREPGDIAKSIVLGAHMVMIGGMFSGLRDSPGAIVMGPDGRQYKEFWGSASAFQSGKKERIEGTKKLLPLKEHGYMDEMKHLTECLESAISYGGGRELNALRNCEFLLKFGGNL